MAVEVKKVGEKTFVSAENDKYAISYVIEDGKEKFSIKLKDGGVITTSTILPLLLETIRWIEVNKPPMSQKTAMLHLLIDVFSRTYHRVLSPKLEFTVDFNTMTARLLGNETGRRAYIIGNRVYIVDTKKGRVSVSRLFSSYLRGIVLNTILSDCEVSQVVRGVFKDGFAVSNGKVVALNVNGWEDPDEVMRILNVFSERFKGNYVMFNDKDGRVSVYDRDSGFVEPEQFGLYLVILYYKKDYGEVLKLLGDTVMDIEGVEVI